MGLAAFLVNWEDMRFEMYEKCKDKILELFDKAWICPQTIVYANEEEQSVLIDFIPTELSESLGEQFLCIRKIRVREFFRLATNTLY